AGPGRWIVGFGPGGSGDILARLMGQGLSERLGQQFIIENRPGASTNIALQAAVNSQPDGHRGGGGDIDYKARRAWRGYGVTHSGPLKERISAAHQRDDKRQYQFGAFAI